MRLDRDLVADLRALSGSVPARLFIGLEALAALCFLWRRGIELVGVVALVWVGLSIVAFVAWWAGRAPMAHPRADPVPAAGGRLLMACVGSAGLGIWGFGLGAASGAVLVLGAICGWLWVAWRAADLGGARARLTRDPRPFLPLLALVALPRLLMSGPGYLGSALLALPSGIGQQLFLLVGLFAPLEAVSRRTDVAAVLSALVFGALHVPMNLDANGGDPIAATANAILVQASVGAIACMAFTRHRAALPIGVAHGLALG